MIKELVFAMILNFVNIDSFISAITQFAHV